MAENLRKMLIKLFTKKRLHLCLKILLIVSIIGVYFIVLLRESFAAWESSVPTTAIGSSAKQRNGHSSSYRDEVNFSLLNFLPLLIVDGVEWSGAEWSSIHSRKISIFNHFAIFPHDPEIK